MSCERGSFTVIEGGVAAGKSTLVGLLQEKELNDGNWKFYREPGGTEFGEYMRDGVMMREYDDFEVNPHAALFAYTASRAQLMRLKIIPKLEEGVNIMLDRYWYSSWAYQGAEGVSKPVIWALSLIATKNTKPDAVLFYKLSLKLAFKRREDKDELDRYDMQQLSFHQKVQRNYAQLKYLYPRIWNEIDASGSIEEVYEETVSVLRERQII